MIGYGGRPHRFPHDNFSSVYWIFTKLGHMIPQWKGKNPIYFGVIRSKVKVTIQSSRNVSVLSDMTSKIWADFAKDWHKIGISQ